MHRQRLRESIISSLRSLDVN